LVKRAPELVVLLEPVAQAVEPLGDRLLGRERERLRALVDLDPRDDPAAGEQLRERRPVRGALAIVSSKRITPLM
jgi:hypothetical protein